MSRDDWQKRLNSGELHLLDEDRIMQEILNDWEQDEERCKGTLKVILLEIDEWRGYIKKIIGETK